MRTKFTLLTGSYMNRPWMIMDWQHKRFFGWILGNILTIIALRWETIKHPLEWISLHVLNFVV